MMRICLSIALISFTACSIASWYAGGGIGRVDYGLEDISSFDDSTGIELIVGNRVNKNLSLEGSYIDFGESDDGIPPVWRIDVNSLTFGALINAPVTQGFDLFLKLGLHMWDGEVTEDGFGIIAEDDGVDLFYGFGAAVDVAEQVSIGARYNIYNYEIEGVDDDATMLLFNVLVGF